MSEKDRLTVVERIYHQSQEDEPTSFETAFTTTLSTVEQPYVRKARIGVSWEALNFGWLERVSMIILVNEEGRNPETIPTAEELDSLRGKVIEIGYYQEVTGVPVGPICLVRIRATESARFAPAAPLDRYYIRSSQGISRYTLVAIPE